MLLLLNSCCELDCFADPQSQHWDQSAVWEANGGWFVGWQTVAVPSTGLQSDELSSVISSVLLSFHRVSFKFACGQVKHASALLHCRLYTQLLIHSNIAPTNRYPALDGQKHLLHFTDSCFSHSKSTVISVTANWSTKTTKIVNLLMSLQTDQQAYLWSLLLSAYNCLVNIYPSIYPSIYPFHYPFHPVV